MDANRHNLPGVPGNLAQFFPQDINLADPAQIAGVLRHVLIRRRRQDIRRNYPDSALNGKPIRFPEAKLSNREYSLEMRMESLG